MAYRWCATALGALYGITACSAQPAAQQGDRQIITVPFDFSPDARNPMDAFRQLYAELGQRAAREARDRDYEPAVSHEQLKDGRWTLVSAITPRRGVFYWVLTGPYDVYGSGKMLEARRDLSVCRFTIPFDGPAIDPLTPTHSWFALAEPTGPAAVIKPECAAPLQVEVERIARWRSDRGKAVCTALGEAGSATLRGWLVEQSKVNHVFDASGAVNSLIERGDTVVRATAAGSYNSPIAHVTTRSGRSFVGFHDSSAATQGYPACVVEGVTWRDLAGAPYPPSPVMASARQLCEQITQRYSELERKQMGRELETNPIKVVPIEELQRRTGGK